MTISIIIPVFNEEKTIVSCLNSLTQQTKKFELIIVDDGSSDNSNQFVNNFKSHFPMFKILTQNHRGPGAARNKGADHAVGDILVFADCDMTFAPDFLNDLTAPIIEKKSKGTFTKEEKVSNWDNVWARCWNYNNNLHDMNRIPKNYPDEAPVFRAILATEFHKVRGFTENVGWTDDWTLSKKLGYQATKTNAECFHVNPDNLIEVFVQAKWIGKNEFLSGTYGRIMFNILRYSFPFSILTGLFKSMFFRTPDFLFFKVIYDLGVSLGIFQSLLGSKNK